MAVLKCKMCGGSLDIKDGQTICECEYCGTKQTIPLLDNDKKNKLYERANRLRFNNEFDRAYTLYQEIINDFPTEAEAYWGLLLCKYGIEYVEDPYTHKRIPTCHRSSFDSIFDDEYFDMVMENAEPDSKLLYREEAKTIEEIRKRIIELSNKEEPYDIFICYKETDDSGNRTIDSVIAQDVYYKLVEKGYRVFFSRISLEDKLGKEYEPYIFAALNSSKAMLVFGTKYEYFNAVWVKNEWSRYLQLIGKGEKKTIIPCYKDIDAYDMPKEFKHLQAQDMGKVGAIQDLLRGIEKIIKNEKQVVEITNAFSSNNANIQSLLTRISIFLEDGDWNNANQYCEKVLDIDPKNAQAYLGKLLVDYKLIKPEDLASLEETFEDNNNYKKVIKFGDEGLKKTLKTYIDIINNKKEENHKLNIYSQTVSLMNTATSEEDYLKVSESFKNIKDFKDSNELAEQCLLKAQEFKDSKIFNEIKKTFDKGENYLKKKNYNEALKMFESVVKELETIENYSKTKELQDKCEEKTKEINTTLHNIEVEKQKLLEQKKNKRSLLKDSIALILAGIIKKRQDKKLKKEKEKMPKGVVLGMVAVIVVLASLFIISIDRIYTYINDNKLYKEAIQILEEQNNPGLAQTRLLSIKNKDCTELIEKIIISYAQNEYYSNSLTSFIEEYGNGNKEELITLACHAYIENDNYYDLKQFVKGFANDEWLLTKMSAVLKNDLGILEEVRILASINSNTSKKLLNEIVNSKEYIGQLHTVNIGETLIYGDYEQDNNSSNGTEPIEWIVLDKRDNQAFLISKYALDYMPYNNTFAHVTWETCSLRKWLNNDFYNAAFGNEEKSSIATTEVIAEKDPNYNTKLGNNTKDKIFLLSIQEAEKYFPSDNYRICKSTAYVLNKERYAFTSEIYWWLRNYDIGQLSGVRPALWINLESSNY